VKARLESSNGDPLLCLSASHHFWPESEIVLPECLPYAIALVKPARSQRASPMTMTTNGQLLLMVFKMVNMVRRYDPPRLWKYLTGFDSQIYSFLLCFTRATFEVQDIPGSTAKRFSFIGESRAVFSPLPVHISSFHPVQSSFDRSNIIRYLSSAAHPVRTTSRAFLSICRFRFYDSMFENGFMRRKEL
jgi:hypothetical protein